MNERSRMLRYLQRVAAWCEAMFVRHLKYTREPRTEMIRVGCAGCDRYIAAMRLLNAVNSGGTTI